MVSCEALMSVTVTSTVRCGIGTSIVWSNERAVVLASSVVSHSLNSVEKEV